jgi:hypothetical protein
MQEPRCGLSGHSRFLRQDGEPGPVQDRERGAIGGQIEVILTRSGSRQSPLTEAIESLADGLDSVVKDPEHLEFIHRSGPYLASPLPPLG